MIVMTLIAPNEMDSAKKRGQGCTIPFATSILVSVVYISVSLITSVNAFSGRGMPSQIPALRRQQQTYSVLSLLATPKKVSEREKKEETKPDPIEAEKHRWLQSETNRLVSSTPHSLDHGLWHQITSLMAAWLSRSNDDHSAPVFMECLLKRLIEEKSAGNKNVLITTQVYNMLLDAWSRQASTSERGKLAARRARDILLLLQQSYMESKGATAKPDMKSFSLVLFALSQSQEPTDLVNFFIWMQKLYDDGHNKDARQLKTLYSIALQAMADSTSENAGIEAERLLKFMLAIGFEPRISCYNYVMKAYISASKVTMNRRNAAENVERVLNEMDIPPDVVCYTKAMNSWVQSGEKRYAAERAERILEQLENNPNVEPDVQAYTSCMNAWVKSQEPTAVEHVKALLHRMQVKHNIRPNLIAYNTYIHALTLQSGKESMAHLAADVLEEIETKHLSGEIDFLPNEFSYSLVFQAFVRMEDDSAPERLMEILKKVIREKRVKLERVLFLQVFNCILRNPSRESANRAEEVLKLMQDTYKAGLMTHAPGALEYSLILDAYTSNYKPCFDERIETLLQLIESKCAAGDSDYKPTIELYNNLMDAWAQKGSHKPAAVKAEALMGKILRLYDAGYGAMQPNTFTYNRLLKCWAYSGANCATQRTGEILRDMWHLYESGCTRVEPSESSYNSFIYALSQSNHTDKAQRALRVLRKMEKLYHAGFKTKPTRYTYNLVLNSCAIFETNLDERATRKNLCTAIFTYEEFQKSNYGSPTHAIYSAYLRAVKVLTPKGDARRDQIAPPVFHHACKHGQVNGYVLGLLKAIVSPDLYDELLSGIPIARRQITFQDLPSEWTRNINRPS